LAEGALVSVASSRESAITEAARRLTEESGADRVLAVAADQREPAAIARWHESTVRRFGGVDLLYCNTGGPPPGAALALEDAAWHGAFDLLVMSAIRLARAVAPGLAERGGGSIVISTSSSVKEPIPSLALSNVLRGAVAALAKTLALELAPQRIRVNHLLPGRIDTDRLREIDAVHSRMAGISLDEQRTRSQGAIPMARYGEPVEFARAAVFLLSDASAYTTGASLQVDGGLIRSVL
jgi:3-oxoacyl-[acyl-carrier protein] reductase